MRRKGRSESDEKSLEALFLQPDSIEKYDEMRRRKLIMQEDYEIKVKEFIAQRLDKCYADGLITEEEYDERIRKMF